MTLGKWLRDAARRLEGIADNPQLEAQILAAHALGKDRTWVIAHPEAHWMSDMVLFDRRVAGEPLPYILGYREFYGRRFNVDPRALIPRQETETLIEAFLKWYSPSPSGREGAGGEGLRVADLGTGSGCIAITLKLECQELDVIGVDVSAGALDVARSNDPNVAFVHADAFDFLRGNPVDIVVSNPPYVASGDELGPGVREWEPGIALFAGDDGLEFYRKLSEFDIPKLFLEVGAGQASAVAALFKGKEIAIHRDLSGVERVVEIDAR